MQIRLDVLEDTLEYNCPTFITDSDDSIVEDTQKMQAIIRFEEKLIGDSLYEFIKKQGCHDMGNAIVLNALYGSYFKYNKSFGLLFYNGKHWVTGLIAESALQMAVTATFRFRRMVDPSKDVLESTIENSAKIESCISRFKLLPSVISDTEQFDKHNHLINVANGVIDLRTGNLLQHSPEYYFTTCSSIEYKPEANYTKWVDFLDTVILNHKDDVSVSTFLKQAVGYSVTGEMKEECMFYLQGQPRAGKGTFVFTLANVLGSLFESRSFSTFSTKRNGNDQGFDLAGLKGKRFVSASESDDKTALNEAIVKNITGRDPITCAHKNKDMFTYAPKFKIWLSSNFLPKGNVDDSAFWARIRLILFSTSFLGKEDKNLKESFQEKSFLEGVLKWVVEGARDYYSSSNGLKTPQCFIDALDQHREAQDTVAQWIGESWKKEEEHKTFIKTKDLYPAYATWCQENDYQPVMKKRLFASLEAKGIQRKTTNVKTKDGKWTTETIIIGYSVDGVFPGVIEVAGLGKDDV